MNPDIRKLIARSAHAARASHIGSALSVVEILEALYFHVANISAENIASPTRDRIILSKGHGSLALYVILAMKGIIPMEYLNLYMRDGGKLPCHIDRESAPGLEASTGSLGHGPGLAQGIALANRLKGVNARIYVIIGDGEFQEGSVQEALNSIGFMTLNEIAIILDNNRFQSVAPTAHVAKVDKYADIFSAWGFNPIEVNGHDVEALTAALRRPSEIPTAIIANTIKGRGFSSMENRLESHYLKIDDTELRRILAELETK